MCWRPCAGAASLPRSAGSSTGVERCPANPIHRSPSLPRRWASVVALLPCLLHRRCPRSFYRPRGLTSRRSCPVFVCADGGGAWKVQHGCHRCCSSAPGVHPWSGLPSPSRGEPRPYMAIAYALPSTVLSDELTARPDPTAHPPHRTKRYQGSLVSTLAAATGPRFAGPTSIPAEH